jgi:ribosome-associated translation inhibitor RaiA
MRLTQFSQGFELTAAIAGHVEHRLQLALGAAADQINAVDVRMTDVNATHGGEDKRCRIVVGLRNLRTVVVESVRRDLYGAIDEAAGAVKEAVWRHLQRRRTLQRGHGTRAQRLYA